jgi:hypothetical protein
VGPIIGQDDVNIRKVKTERVERKTLGGKKK